ncbi:antibiotic biosynthesis monooxygenase [Halorubrum sp. 2020YC2]|uniref:antibiotic biosynthesis monooxygenase n=1 Tax=Halorubrum sp. 2020YC2 TaxID=2836432 RepID=UPI001BEBE887|nr:antibiotic biosynthesis monooxygenase [Halorubrum sp. 2020YC2]QWC20344.1 antibiotic biosynthesis monooxygenase [Halorubrum sp. 2020YC2]
MIDRIWHGWTTPEDADEYERLLREEILPSFAAADNDGYRGARVLRREGDPEVDGDEVEFVTVLRFDSFESVTEFAGEAYRDAHVPPAAREVLERYDDRARHYEVREEREY